MQIKEIIIKDHEEIIAELKEVLAQMSESEWYARWDEFLPFW